MYQGYIAGVNDDGMVVPVRIYVVNARLIDWMMD